MSSVELSSTLQPVQLVTLVDWELALRSLQAWLMGTHSCSWKVGGLRAQLGEPNDGSVQPAMYVFPAKRGERGLVVGISVESVDLQGLTFCVPARIRIAQRQAVVAELTAWPGLDGTVATWHKIALGLCVFGVVAGPVRDTGIDGCHDR